jgi:hypothetical protein
VDISAQPRGEDRCGSEVKAARFDVELRPNPRVTGLPITAGSSHEVKQTWTPIRVPYDDNRVIQWWSALRSCSDGLMQEKIPIYTICLSRMGSAHLNHMLLYKPSVDNTFLLTLKSIRAPLHDGRHVSGEHPNT